MRLGIEETETRKSGLCGVKAAVRGDGQIQGPVEIRSADSVIPTSPTSRTNVSVSSNLTDAVDLLRRSEMDPASIGVLGKIRVAVPRLVPSQC